METMGMGILRGEEKRKGVFYFGKGTGASFRGFVLAFLRQDGKIIKGIAWRGKRQQAAHIWRERNGWPEYASRQTFLAAHFHAQTCIFITSW
jgi:hypothetical protein